MRLTWRYPPPTSTAAASNPACSSWPCPARTSTATTTSATRSAAAPQPPWAARVDVEHPNWRQVTTPDPLAAFQALARGIRQSCTATVVGVTGSNGKTSTKQALAAALGGHGFTLATDRSENTDVGVPSTLSRLLPAHRFAVIEMGAQIRGEIASYCRVTAPDAAVITSISGAHIGLFGAIEAIVEAKSELLTALPDGAPAVLPADSRWLHELRARAPGPRPHPLAATRPPTCEWLAPSPLTARP